MSAPCSVAEGSGWGAHPNEGGDHSRTVDRRHAATLHGPQPPEVLAGVTRRPQIDKSGTTSGRSTSMSRRCWRRDRGHRRRTRRAVDLSGRLEAGSTSRDPRRRAQSRERAGRKVSVHYVSADDRTARCCCPARSVWNGWCPSNRATSSGSRSTRRTRSWDATPASEGEVASSTTGPTPTGSRSPR